MEGITKGRACVFVPMLLLLLPLLGELSTFQRKGSVPIIEISEVISVEPGLHNETEFADGVGVFLSCKAILFC